jgi:hypothetical protein
MKINKNYIIPLIKNDTFYELYNYTNKHIIRENVNIKIKRIVWKIIRNNYDMLYVNITNIKDNIYEK